MIALSTFDVFYELVNKFQKDNIQFYVFGSSTDTFTGAMALKPRTAPKTENNTLALRYFICSSVGTFSYQQQFKFNDEKLAEIKEKLLHLPVTTAAVSKSGIESF